VVFQIHPDFPRIFRRISGAQIGPKESQRNQKDATLNGSSHTSGLCEGSN